MIEADIRRLLAVAADDKDAPAGPPPWLQVERVRAYRRRQRQVGTTAVLGAASTVAGVAITLGSAASSAAHPPPGGGHQAAGPTDARSGVAGSSDLPAPTGGGGPARPPRVVVRTETRTVDGRPKIVVVSQTLRFTTSVPGALRTMLLHDTVTATATVTASVTATQTDTATRSVTTTRTVTTTVDHTVRTTVTAPPPPPQTVTVTITQGPSQPG